MKAKKSYGQHFLINEEYAERIANSLLQTNDYPRVLEVGPGKGMLTKYLLKKGVELKVVEADRDMVAFLQKNYPQLTDRIIASDFLKLRLENTFDQQPFALIGNFPYNISSQILFKMVDYRDLIPEMAGMFQLEVAERVVAPPGTKTYGVISVLIQAYYEGELLFRVEPRHFNPPPKVQSAVIRFTRKKNQELGCDSRLFKRVVKQAFSQRRKMLRNTMKTFTKDPDFLARPELSLRPEQFSLQDFVWLTNLIAAVI